MMKQIKVNGFQLFSVIFLFELGSAILLGVARESKQDAWITVLLGIIFGCVLYLVFTKLYSMYPSRPLTGFLQIILGRYIGWFMGLLYVIYFIYIASRVLRDFEALLVISAYRQSSLLTIGIIMVLCVMYAAHKGLEVFFRISELCLFVILFMFSLLIVFEFASGIFEFNHLRPVLEHGWRPILKNLFPTVMTFPFGEMVAFTMLLPHINKRETAKKIGIMTIVVSGLVLTLFTIMNIAIVGPNIANRSSFPILTAVSYINIADFVQRLDILVIISMVILGFVKLTVFFFCALIGTADLFHFKQPNTLIYPIGVIVLISSFIIAHGYIEHIQEGLKVVPYYLHLPLQIVIPILLLVIALIKEKVKAKAA
jgi:spore germination protein KB